jgi:ElaB/YqjD/DUF883 family membrane-anchored ribosome-binding protein
MEAKNSGNGVQRVDTYSKTAHQAVDRAAEAAAAAAGRIGEKGDELLEMKDQWLEGAVDYVRENPFKAIGIAVAAGYLLSMMMRSK